MIIFGLGSGRCGTSSLQRLLNNQTDTTVTHEMAPVLPWDFDERRLSDRIANLSASDDHFTGDVGYSYLSYVKTISERIESVRFVCLERETEAVVRSMLAKTEGRNHWAEHDGTVWTLDPVWDPTMPSYETMPKEAAVRRYLREYYETAEVFASSMPDQFRVFPTESLNSLTASEELLRFCGFTDDLNLDQFRENRLLT